MKTADEKLQLLAQAERVTFETAPSSLLQEAMQDYEAQQPALEQGDLSRFDEAWSVLANQVVGHETF